MPSPIKFKQDEINKIIDLYNNGINSHKIGKIFNLSCQPILRILHNNNVKLKNYYDEINEKDIINDYKNKMTIKQISIKYKRGNKFIHDILKKNNIDINRKYECNYDYFNIIDNSEKSYWLGFLYADGNVDKYRMSLHLNKKDIKHLNKLKISLNSNTPIKTMEKDICGIRIDNKKFVDNLIKNGCVSRKTFVITFPNIDEKYYADFIRGYFDGDGSICTCKNGKNIFDITCASYVFIEKIRNILIEKLNINKKRKVYKNRNCFNISWSNLSDIKQLYDFLYYKDDIIYLDRKKEKFNLILNDNI